MFRIQILNTQLYAPHMTSIFIPDVVTSPLALHVMEDGCLAAPERGVSIFIFLGAKVSSVM